jgi:hypothetical protein
MNIFIAVKIALNSFFIAILAIQKSKNLKL